MCKGETDVEKPTTTSSVVQKEHKHVALVQTEETMEFQPVTSPSSQRSPTESAEALVHSNEHSVAKSLTVSDGFRFAVIL